MFRLHVLGICCIFAGFQGVSLSLTPSGLTCARPGIRRDDYTYTPGIGAHKVHTKAVSWNKAWEICRNEGGHLAILNSYAESKLVVKLLEKAGAHVGSTHAWLAHIGFHDHFTKNAWVTLQGQSLQEAGFNEWYEGEPNNSGDKERCGSVYISDGRLNDQDCERYMCGYICELPYIEPEIPIQITSNFSLSAN